jgi:hypothetical protein
MAKKKTRPKPKFFHDADGLNFEPRITTSLDPANDYKVDGLKGPFDTFSEAKADAVQCAKEQIALAKYRLDNTRALRAKGA